MASTGDTTGTIDPRWARVRPLVFRTIIGAVVAAGLIGIVAVLLGDFGRVAVQLLLTIVVVVVFALLSWYDADVSSRRSGTFAFVSIAVSMYLLVTGLTKVWVVPRDPYGGDGVWIVGEHFWQWLGIVFVARFALLHVHLLLVIHRRYPTPVLQLVAKVTVGVIALLALLLSVPLLAPDTDLARGYWRLVWVVVILDLLGTVVVPLSNALFRPRHGDDRRPASAATTAATWAQPVGVARHGAPVPTAPVSWADTPAPGTAVAVPPTTGGEERGAGSTVTASDGLVYERRPEQARALAWPRFVDGTPLPAAADGSPDFSGVARS